ncbi:unnamed protein product [Closterium sp. NIES-65]|nr:unnamed protein product [Closterium sp. NIES-65]
MAPGRCSNRSSCEQGDSSTEPYIVSHHIMLAHAAAVAVYRRRYSSQLGGGGRIGMTMDCVFLYPADGSQESVDAAQQGMEFAFAWWVGGWVGGGWVSERSRGPHGQGGAWAGGRMGMTMDCVLLFPADGTRGSVGAAQRGMEFAFTWFADPLFRGDYPPSMRQAVGSRLPSFSAAESSLLIGSSDFIGLNFYTAQYAAQKTVRAGGEVADVADGVAPWMDCHVDMTGMSESNLPSRSLARTLCDDQRVRFYRSYLSSVLQAKWYDPLTLLPWPLLSLYRSYLSSVLQARRYDD